MNYGPQEHEFSIRRACRIVGISCSEYRYRPDTSRDDKVIAVPQLGVERYPAHGFGKLLKIIRCWGYGFNHKRVHPIYRLPGLNKRRRGKKRLPNRERVTLQVPEAKNQCWSMDLTSDSLFCGRRYRTFNVVDDFNREALAIEVELDLPSPRIIRVVDRLAAWRGYPSKVRMDNGPEFISIAMAEWADDHGIDPEFIQPGKPTQNSYVERFNRTYRDEILNMYVFKTLNEVRELTDNWIREYNQERPHDSLEDLTPIEYLNKYDPAGNSNRM